MPTTIARTADVIAKVKSALETEAQAGFTAPGLLHDSAAKLAAAHQTVDANSVAADAAATVAGLIGAVDSHGKGMLSKAEVLSLAAQNGDAGAHVARAYHLITGRTIDIPAPSSSLADQLPADWKKALKAEIAKPYFKDLEKFVADERTKANVLPPADVVFAALKRTPLSKVKVVLLGQDPYPTAGNANGLSFSVAKGKPIPASLQNMLDTAHADVGTTVPNNGDLTPWADQGVLLLNTVLTVREGDPDSHKDHGWETFTQAILDLVDARKKRVVFLLLGKQAQQAASHVDTSKHVVVEAPHPSPMVPGNPFGKTHVFSDVNKALVDGHRAPIDWQIPDA